MTIFDDITHHFFHYILLLVIILAGLAIFWAIPYQPESRFWIITALCAIYVLWGIGHHVAIHRHIHPTIVVEYVLIATLAVILIYGILGL